MFMYNVDFFFSAGRALRKSLAVFSLLAVEFGFLLPAQGRQTHQAGSQVGSGTATEGAEGKASDRPSIAADLEVPTPSAAVGAKEQRKSGSKKNIKEENIAQREGTHLISRAGLMLGKEAHIAVTPQEKLRLHLARRDRSKGSCSA